MKTQSLHAALYAFAASVLLVFSTWPGTSHGAFTDVTTAAGLTSPTESRGAAWGDYNADNCVDLYVAGKSGGALYRNNCNATFSDVTGAAGLIAANNEWGVAWADYDGDSDLDLYIGRGGVNALYRNNGDGTFTDVGAAAGVADSRGTAGVSWTDYNGDGFLDLFVANRFTAGNRADGLYQNNGDGTFTDVAAAAGVAGDIDRTTFMGVWFDYDNDGDSDLYLSVDFGDDVLYRNNGNGTFTDVSIIAGISDPQHGMGTTVGDINNDGCLDVLSTNNTQGLPGDAEHNASALYLNNCNGTFTRASESMGVLDRAVIEWGANLVDYDNDMDLDLSLVSGASIMGGPGQPNVLYENSGSCNAALSEITANAGVSNSDAAYGSVWADYDNDGDLDWFVANEVGSDVLYRNDSPSGNHLKVRLFGAGANTHGVGALVTMTAGGVEQSRFVQAGTSYASAEESHAFFGLGVKDTAERLSVLWPSGALTQLTNISAGNVDVTESGAPPPPPPPPPPPGGDAAISGTTFNPGGTPESDVRVRLWDSAAGLEVAMTTSDALGLYSLSAPAGAYKLQAIKLNSGFKNFSMDITLASGEVRTQDITLGGTPPPPPPPPSGDAVVSGTTFNPSGIAEPGVSVRIRDSVTRQNVVSTVSDAAGQYSLTSPPGSYKLQAIKPNSGFGNTSVDITLNAGDTVTQDLTLRP